MRTFQWVWALVISALLLSVQAKAGAENAPCDTSFFYNTICPGQSLFIAGTIFDAQNLTGLVLLPGASWDGTDSVVVVDLSLSPPVTHEIRTSYCNNEALVVNGHIYDAGHPSGTELLPGAAAGGCDSLIVVDLTFLPPAFLSLQQTICKNDTVWVNNQAYDQYYYLGMETVAGGAANGCDSIILVDLTVLPTPVDSFFQTLCPSSALYLNGSTYDINHPSGTDILPGAAANGCDLVVYVGLSFYDAIQNPDFLGENRSVNKGTSVCLDVPADVNASSIEWSPFLACPDSLCAAVCFWATRHQWVICTIEDQNGCVFADSVRIEVSEFRPVFIPNVCSPDAPAPNNRFQVFSGIPGTHINWLKVCDRWGSLVYAASDIPVEAENAGWDGMIKGKMAPTDVYTYAVELVYPDGEKEIRSGTVTVLSGD
jgi:CHU_C Type IX secretion signal domain